MVPGQIYTQGFYLICVCVDDASSTGGQTGGGALERVQIFILAEGLKWSFMVLSGR